MLKSLLNKGAGRKVCNFIKKRLQHRCFPVNIGKFLRTPILKNICVRVLLKRLSEVIVKTFLKSHFQNHLDSVILQKYKWLSNQNFKHNSVHMPSLNLTPTLSFEPRFRMFIINGYDRKANAISPWPSCYLKRDICRKKADIGKAVGDSIVGFKSRMNQHISDSRTEVSACKFPIHVYM